MRRRNFLHVLLAGALGALGHRILAHAQSPTASRLAEGQPSATAQFTASLRAAHQLVDHPRIFDDPLALRIIGAQAEAAVRARAGKSRMAWLRPFVAVRSRYAEDELARAVQRGVHQYVVLGAGLDTFAYRNPYPGSQLRVFEVDHPATQAWKQGRLKDTGIAIPDSVTFAAIDFEKQTLAGGLRQAGFRAEESAFFSMLGVVPYLTRNAAIDTLKVVASLPPGTEIVFDYAIPPATLGKEDRARHDDAAGVVATRGEPWLTYFEPATLGAELRAIGLKQGEDLGPDELHERYFKGRTDGLRLPTLARLVKAGR